jgi:uncharacterized coiled-coil protein SlyX
MEKRIIELETRLAFQEKTIEELNGAMAGQQLQLAAMEEQFARLSALLAKALPILARLEEED